MVAINVSVRSADRVSMTRVSMMHAQREAPIASTCSAERRSRWVACRAAFVSM